MGKLSSFIRKQPESSDDYLTAYNIVNAIKQGQSKTVTPDNLKVFRKYIYDLGAKQGKEFTTRKQLDNSLKVICI
jgi:hypothetical protein